MSDFPTNYDNDITLPAVSNNITEIGEEAINALREAILNIENNIGLNANGSQLNISSRLNVALNNDGTIKTSVLSASGLITLPITNSDISDNASIKEYKLSLDYKTSDLYNYIRDLSNDVNSISGWINTDGINLNPHLNGTIVRHDLSHIDVSSTSANYFKNKFDLLRNNTNSFTAIKDLNDDFVNHQKSDGVQNGSSLVTTVSGESFPQNYAHTASAVFLDTSRWSFLPQSNNDLQKLSNYLDSSSIFLYGTRIQNLYSNGISRESRSSSLLNDGYGIPIIPETTVSTYLLNNGLSGSPVDDILIGDDVIRFYPDNSVLSNKKFHNQFASVKPGDLLRINYGGLQTSFIIKEKKYISNDLNSVFIVRVNGKNLKHTSNAIARIDRSLVNDNKYGSLGITPVNNLFSAEPSLLVINPRCAQTLGNGFNPNSLNSSNYLLYLALFPTGNLSDGYTILPGIDVTGNLGVTPGQYTLSSIVDATNKSFRALGYNYRFVAFSCNGEFGIALADAVDNVGFSIISGAVSNFGVYDQLESELNFPKNVIDLFSSKKLDPLGLGPNGSASASPPYQNSYGSSDMALVYTKLFLPLKRNTYYVNGAEKDNLQTDVNQIQDNLGDGYWIAEVTSVDILSNRVKTTYRVNLDLSQSKLDIGSTVFIKSITNTSIVNSGRFIVENLNINCPPNEYTEIVVYDSVHGAGFSPIATLEVGNIVSIYYNSESITFNKSNVSDYIEHLSYKRHFETYIDDNGNTFNHERARFIITGSNIAVNEGITLYTDLELSKININSISPKLYGYSFGSISKITLNLTYSSTDNSFSGYLCNFDGYSVTKQGPVSVGRIGSSVRFYDYSRNDYIDFEFNINTSVNSFTNKKIDIQLFKSLENDKQVMILCTSQLNDVSKQITNFIDKRQFGNISENNFTNSALNYISASDKILHSNGVVRGFEYVLNGTNSEVMSGGVAIVNGNIVQMNSEVITIPSLKELYNSAQYNIMFALCLNDKGQYVTIGLVDNHEEFDLVNNVNRSIVGYNPVNGQTYNLETDKFENLVNKRKDILVLYLVYCSGTLADTIDTIDVRRYAVNTDSVSPLVYTNSDCFGNFNKASAMFAWLQYNNSHNYSMYLSDLSETISDPILIDYESVVTIDGRGTTNITFNSGSYPTTRAIPKIGSNVIIKNINFLNTIGFEFLEGSSNVIFENCEFNYLDNESITLLNCSNYKFINCTFNIDTDTASHLAIIKVKNCSDIHFEKCIFNSTSLQYSSTYISFISSNNCSVIRSTFTGNFTIAINLYLSNDITIDYNVFNWSEVVLNGDVYVSDSESSLPFWTFNSSNLINNRRGLIFSSVQTEINNIFIRYNKMSFTHTSTLRFGFITFNVTTANGNLVNCDISNNKFFHLETSDDYDVRPIITLSNTSSSTNAPESLKAPKLTNVFINNNYANRQQIIGLFCGFVIDSFNLPGFSFQNVQIKNNICGVISYLGSNPNVNSYDNEVNSNILIDSNSCKLICHLSSSGERWYSYLPTASSSTSLCNAVITNNTTSWIGVSVVSKKISSIQCKSSLIISNNKLNAFNYNFVDLFGDDGGDVIPVTGQPTSETGKYAIRVVSYRGSGLGVYDEIDPCIITNNIVQHGRVMDQIGNFTNYSYQQGYIYTKCRATITNNILNGIDSSGTDYNLIFINGYNAIVTGNIINGKDPTDTYKYVYVAPGENNYVTSGLITGNHFYNSNTGYDGDSRFVYIPNGNWRVHTNVNQIAYAIIPLTDGLRYGNDFGLPSFATSLNTSDLPTFNFSGSFAGNNPNDFGLSTANNNVNPAQPSAQTFEYAGAKSDVLRIRYTAPYNFGYSMEIAFQKNLKHVIPPGCKIKSISIGVRRFGDVVTTSSSNDFNTRFNFGLYEYIDGYNSNSLTNLDRFADGYAKDTLLPITTNNMVSVYGSEINATSLTVEKSKVVTNLFTYSDKEIIASFSGHITKTSGNVDIMISPLIIKYTW